MRFSGFIRMSVPPAVEMRPGARGSCVSDVCEITRCTPPMFMFRRERVFDSSLVSLGHCTQILFRGAGCSTAGFFGLESSGFELAAATRVGGYNVVLLR